MRKFLNGIYFAGAALAAVCLLLSAGIIIAQILGRILGFVVPSANTIAGFLMAGVIFLALPYSFRAGAHIRVELVLNAFGGSVQRILNFGCLVAAIGVTAFMTWNFLRMVMRAVQYGDISDGLIGVPLWLPQSAFVTGLALFLVALIDEVVCMLAGGCPAFAVATAEARRDE